MDKKVYLVKLVLDGSWGSNPHDISTNLSMLEGVEGVTVWEINTDDDLVIDKALEGLE